MNRMTCAFALFMLVVFSASAAFAGAAGDLHYGIKVGPNFSFAYAEGGRTSFKPGVAGGVFLSYNLSELFQIQPEVLFIMKGWKEEAGALTLTNKLNYVDINLLFKLMMPTEKKVKSSLGVGPYLGIKMSDSYEFNVAVTDEVTDIMEQIYSNLRSYDMGLVINGGIDVLLQSGHMVVFDVRATVGMMSIFEEMTIGDVTFNVVDLKNMGIQLMAGYAF